MPRNIRAVLIVLGVYLALCLIAMGSFYWSESIDPLAGLGALIGKFGLFVFALSLARGASLKLPFVLSDVVSD